MKDKTVGISIIIALLFIAILVIIIVTGCSDSFANIKNRNIGFFKDISDKRWGSEMNFLKKRKEVSSV